MKGEKTFTKRNIYLYVVEGVYTYIAWKMLSESRRLNEKMFECVGL